MNSAAVGVPKKPILGFEAKCFAHYFHLGIVSIFTFPLAFGVISNPVVRRFSGSIYAKICLNQADVFIHTRFGKRIIFAGLTLAEITTKIERTWPK